MSYLESCGEQLRHRLGEGDLEEVRISLGERSLESVGPGLGEGSPQQLGPDPGGERCAEEAGLALGEGDLQQVRVSVSEGLAEQGRVCLGHRGGEQLGPGLGDGHDPEGDLVRGDGGGRDRGHHTNYGLKKIIKSVGMKPNEFTQSFILNVVKATAKRIVRAFSRYIMIYTKNCIFNFLI